MSIERWFLLALVGSSYLFWHYWQDRPVVHPPGVLVPSAPTQVTVNERTFTLEDFTISTQARFELQARVLSRKDYGFDPGAAISPLDLALGWGPMSDQAVLDQMKVSQGGRWFHLRWDTPPLPEKVILDHSSNMHIIPANDTVLDGLDDVLEGQVVQLSGYLVNASGPDGFVWNSSMSRTDRGNGACELFYVERIMVW